MLFLPWSSRIGINHREPPGQIFTDDDIINWANSEAIFYDIWYVQESMVGKTEQAPERVDDRVTLYKCIIKPSTYSAVNVQSNLNYTKVFTRYKNMINDMQIKASLTITYPHNIKYKYLRITFKDCRLTSCLRKQWQLHVLHVLGTSDKD